MGSRLNMGSTVECLPTQFNRSDTLPFLTFKVLKNTSELNSTNWQKAFIVKFVKKNNKKL